MSWYESRSNWYKPNYTAASEQAQNRPVPPLPQASRKGRIIAIIACAVIIAAAIIAAVLNPTPVSHDSSDGDEILPDNWKDYFEEYYGGDSAYSKADVKLPTVSDRGNPELRFEDGVSGSVLSLNEVYSKCSPSIVGIKCFTKDTNTTYSWGSGVIVSADGYIITNTHVIDGGKSAEVELYDGTSYDAKLVGFDTQSDIAVLKIDAKDLTPASFATSSSLTVGDTVAAIGNPLSEEYRLTMTSGIISAMSREVTFNGSTMTLLQTDTAINEGNSGGPLINSRGQVIGITNMKIVSSYSSVEGIGFAIPSDTVKDVFDSIISNGAVYGRSTIGITVAPIREAAAEHYDLPHGLYVAAVEKHSDAAKQGLEVNDILLKANGQELHSNADLAGIKAGLKIGDTINFTVWRDGKTFDVSVKLMDANDIYK